MTGEAVAMGGIEWSNWIPFIAAISAVVLTALFTSYRDSRRWTKDQRRHSYVKYLSILSQLTLMVTDKATDEDLKKTRYELEAAYLDIQFFSSKEVRRQAVKTYDELSKYWGNSVDFKASWFNREHELLKSLCVTEMGSLTAIASINLKHVAKELYQTRKLLQGAEGRIQAIKKDLEEEKRKSEGTDSGKFFG